MLSVAPVGLQLAVLEGGVRAPLVPSAPAQLAEAPEILVEEEETSAPSAFLPDAPVGPIPVYPRKQARN